MQNGIDNIRWVAPFIVGFDRQSERGASPHLCRQQGTPLNARSRHDGNRRAFGQGHVIISCNGVNQHPELELPFAVGLNADTGRAVTAVTEANGNGIARCQEMLHNANVERPAPGADIALELPFKFEKRPVRCLRRRIALPFRILELHGTEIGRETETDLD